MCNDMHLPNYDDWKLSTPEDDHPRGWETEEDNVSFMEDEEDE